MKDILNNHQILYAKNFYKHSGDIVKDMKKVCKLDCPSATLSTPENILYFMREQYKNWLDATPEVHRNIGSKVAWDDDPVKAEMWAMINSYSCFIPMTNIGGWIKGLPDYNALAPQYNCYMKGMYERPFRKEMTIEEKTEKAKEILNMPMMDIMDPMATVLSEKYNYEKASEILSAFGMNAKPEDLDDELWNLYSDIVEEHSRVVDGVEVLDCGDYTKFSNHFVLDMCSKHDIHSTVGLKADLCVMKWSIVSDNETSEETFRSDYEKLSGELFEAAKIDSLRIAEVCSNVDNEALDFPDHLKIIDNVEDTMKESLNILLDYWDGDEYSTFSKRNGDTPLNCGTGCFSTYIFNENGKLKIVLGMDMLFDCFFYEHELRSHCSAFINDVMD